MRRRKSTKPLIEVHCAGCGRMQHTRHVEPCDGYTCALGSCRLNPAFRVPKPPEGFVCVEVFQAAGGFSGYQIRRATAEDLAGIARAASTLRRVTLYN